MTPDQIAQEHTADEAQRETLERHIAMRLTSIIKAEENKTRTRRATFLTLLVLSFVVVLVGIIAVVVQNRAIATRNNERTYNLCLARNEQSRSITPLVRTLVTPGANASQQPPTERQKQTVAALLAFEKAFAKQVDCESLIR